MFLLIYVVKFTFGLRNIPIIFERKKIKRASEMNYGKFKIRIPIQFERTVQ